MTHFFYGGHPGVADRLAQALTARFPGLRVVGTHSPPFGPLSDSQFADLQQRIHDTRPDFLRGQGERQTAREGNLRMILRTSRKLGR